MSNFRKLDAWRYLETTHTHTHTHTHTISTLAHTHTKHTTMLFASIA